VVDTLATPAKALMDTTKFADSIHKGVNAFMEAVPPLMKALDEVGNIHPFIKGASPFSSLRRDDRRTHHIVAVLAFKAVYTLEKKRRENDKRILALYVECVALNVDPSPSSHELQNERHDGGSPQVGFVFLPFRILP
jgi:hypothetical protein